MTEEEYWKRMIDRKICESKYLAVVSVICILLATTLFLILTQEQSY